MNTDRNNFRKAFAYEAGLMALFLSGLAAHFVGIIPPESEKIVLGLMGIIGLIPVARSAWQSILQKKINVDLLATVALFFSFISGEWVSMIFINLMLTSARALDLYTKRRSRISLESLAKMKPSQARIVKDGKIELVPLTKVKIGDFVSVNLGEQIPTDGTVVKGEATVDQSSLTGESMPVLRTVNDMVLSATVISSGNLIVRAERIGDETTFERMIKLVESAQEAKTRMKTMAERFAAWYISLMLIVAFGLFAITRDVKLVLSVVLVVCADDIAIAIPLAYITGIGTAARQGIIVKGADFLEGFSKITTLIVDKTGTVTLGKLIVKNMQPLGGVERSKILELSGVVCKGSTHPISKAIVKFVEQQDITLGDSESFEEKEGRGIRGFVDDTEVLIGRLEFMKEHGIYPSIEATTSIQKEEEEANNVTLVAVNGTIAGMFALADEMREDIHSTISILKQQGIKETIMLTGDNEIVARTVAKNAGIDTYYAGLLPENKVSILAKYLGPQKTVAMVGDGVNDAAVLARADIGIAMGGIGSDAAIESADVVLMQDDFKKIIDLRNIAKNVLNVAKSNFVIWAVVNTIGLFLVFTGVLDPPKAAAFNFLTDFIPIANSLRLFYYKK